MNDIACDEAVSATTKRNGFDIDRWTEEGINLIPKILEQIERNLTVPPGHSILDYCEGLAARAEELARAGEDKELLAILRDTDAIYAQLYMGLVYTEAALDNNPYHALSFIIRTVGLYALTPDWRNDAVLQMRARNRADKRWRDDPTQEAKEAIYKAWEKWNPDRREYPRPRDFRKAILTRHPAISDGTLKNWMSDWPKGKNLPRVSRS